MPDIGVDATVEKMMKGGSQATPAEHPSGSAPAANTAGSKEETTHVTDTETLSAFDQELITEYQEEYDAAKDKSTFLSALKKSYRKQAKQMTELGQLRKAVNALKDAGVTNDDLLELINQRKGKSAPKVSGNGSDTPKRGFQRYLKDDTAPAEREHLREAEQVVRELVEDMVEDRLTKEVKPIREKLDADAQEARSQRRTTLVKEIDELEDVHGFKGSLVETYREQMMELGLRNPKWSARKLLQILANEDEYDHGRMAGAKSSKESETPSKGQRPASVVKQSSTELPRDKRGRISVSSALDFLLKPKR